MEKIGKIDKIDKKIIFELEKNLRTPNSKIAKEVGISKQVLGNRIKRMENENIIHGYWSVVDYHKIGFDCATISLRLNLRNKEMREKIEEISPIENVGWVGLCYGKWDLIVAVFYEEISELNETMVEIFSIFKENIVEHFIFENTENHSLHIKMFNPEKPSPKKFTAGQGGRKKISELDYKILQILSKESRINLVELSKKSNLSIPTLKKHINNLIEEEVILGFRPIVNFIKLGYMWNTLNLRIDKTKEEKLIYYLSEHERVIFISKGVSDILNIDVLTKDPLEFKKLMDQFREECPGIIESFQLTTIIDIIKNINFLPKRPSYLESKLI
jgi:Lrp/AsnC family transcriptional regulator, leucine-responsive regulatory protein